LQGVVSLIAVTPYVHAPPDLHRHHLTTIDAHQVAETSTLRVGMGIGLAWLLRPLWLFWRWFRFGPRIRCRQIAYLVNLLP
jgi:hypothetical protein